MNSFLDQSTGYLVNITALLLKRELNNAIKQSKINITTEQWAILNRLNEEESLSQNEVAIITFKDNANITRILDKLETKGLVQRKPDPKDRRTWRISITKKGEAQRNLIEPLAKKVLEKALNGLSTKEVAMYNEISKKIIANLKN